MVDLDKRIQSVYVRGHSEKELNHLYTRFIGDKTELWLFGEGLGERAMILELGDSFLQLVESGEDPGLGRIMMGLGENDAAQAVYKGNWNLCWIWGVDPDKIGLTIHYKSVKPQLILSSNAELRKRANEIGFETLPMHSGVNTRFFYPLNTPRKGLGYCGVDNKSAEQMSIVLQPAMAHGDFEWISKSVHVAFPECKPLNEWINSKQIVFGMVPEDRQRYGYLPTRFPQTIATEVPLINYKMPGVDEALGIHYPFYTDNPEQTTKNIDYILSHEDEVKKYMAKLGKKIRKEQDYRVKLREIFKRLKEMKK